MVASANVVTNPQDALPEARVPAKVTVARVANAHVPVQFANHPQRPHVEESSHAVAAV